MITHLRVIETLRLLSWQSCLPPPAAFFRLTSDELESRELSFDAATKRLST